MRTIALLALVPAAVLGTQQPTTHLSGTVLSTWSGEPRAQVEVSVLGHAVRTTDAAGRFDFPALPSGHAKLVVRYAGRASAEQDIDLPAGKTLRLEMLVDSSETPFDPIIVQADHLESHLGLAGFYARRRLGFGRFFSRADIERTHDHLVDQVLATVGATYRCGGSGCAPVTFRFGRECRMAVLIDGYPPAGQDVPGMALDDVAAMEVYRNGADAGAGVTLQNGYALGALAGRCGLVVIWTRAAVPGAD